MITIAVCDDNVLFAKLLISKIKEICAVKIPERYMCRIAAVMSSSQAVLDYVKENTINILFLDIDMPGMNGFELAEKINRICPDTLIIFVSAHENFVFSSFQYNPFRFLRKSKIDAELEDTLVKAIERYMSGTEVITVKAESEMVELRVRDIIHIESSRNYYIIYGTGFEYRCRGTISQVEKELKDYGFFRISSGRLINLERIERFEAPNCVVMENVRFYISQRRVADFKTTFMNYTRKRVM